MLYSYCIEKYLNISLLTSHILFGFNEFSFNMQTKPENLTDRCACSQGFH